MTLYIKPINALLAEDPELFGTADPYVVCIVGDEKKQGKVHKDGGKNPEFKDSFIFDTKEPVLRVQLWDKDTFSADDLIGQGTMDLVQCYNNVNRPEKEYVDLRLKEKVIGRLFMHVQFQGPPRWTQNNNWNPNLLMQQGNSFPGNY